MQQESKVVMDVFERSVFAAIVGEKKMVVISELCRLRDERGFAFASIEKLCELANASKPTVINTLNLLKEKGVIERVKNGVYKFCI